MKHLKTLKGLKSSILKIKENSQFIENVNIHKTHVKKICDINLPDPEFGDLKLSVMPFENTGEFVSLPDGFKRWEESFNEILKLIPLQEGANTHYVTIDTKFFTTDQFLRREGVHIDGNFCVDPNFKSINEEKKTWGGAGFNDGLKKTWGGAGLKKTWGGAGFNSGAGLKKTWGGAGFNSDGNFTTNIGTGDDNLKKTWGGAGLKKTWGGAGVKNDEEGSNHGKIWEAKEDNSHVQMDWVLPYKLVIPIADYVSEKRGGILTTSTEVGCQAWSGTFKGEILSEGSFINMEDQLTDDKKIVFEKNGLYFMSSNTPHETLMISKGKRRTFLRITLNHDYLNEKIINGVIKK